MERRHHLEFERYLDTLEGRRTPASLALASHRHTLECCDVCREEWELVAGEQSAARARLAETRSFPGSELNPPQALGPEECYLPEAGTFAAQPIEEVERRKRHRRRKVRQELWELLQLPRAERPDLLRRAYKRFRSRALAEELVAESRARVRTEPREAESLASLVPRVLEHARGDEEPGWVTRLVLTAAAHQANAVRIGGDLEGAERRFRRIHREMAVRDVRDPRLIAEVASLEASVAIDQRRFGDAEAGLGLALLAARRAAERKLVLRILLQEAFLQWQLGNPKRTLRRYDKVESLLTSEDGYLGLSIVTSHILTLCDLERFAKAEETLLRHQEVFEQEEDVHTGATLCAVRGRIALGLGRLDEAAAAFAMARDDLLAIGRYHDAALACLDLAETHLRRGDAIRLGKLVARLVRLFEARGVERETLAVIQRLAHQAGDGDLTTSSLRQLRQCLLDQFGAPTLHSV